jgi:hypothetical protein
MVLLRSEKLRLRNIGIAAIVGTVSLTIATIAFLSLEEKISSYTVVGMLIFYAIPIGCGVIILQGLRLYFDPYTRIVSWLFILVGIILLLGFAFFIDILNRISMSD